MTGGVTLAVRQIGSYPSVGGVGPGDLLLMQPGGLGNPYASIDAATLVATALAVEGGPLGLGVVPPTGADGAQAFADNLAVANGALLFNAYWNGTDIAPFQSGNVGVFDLVPGGSGFQWQVANGPANQPLAPLSQVMTLSNAGALGLPLGTLTVARDPGAAMEVATMGWVGRSTVTSFNGRKGAVILSGCDIYSALCLDSTIATENWVNANIQASIQMLLANHPFVFGWNGRTGAVYLTLADISCVFFQPGQQPIAPTAPAASDDYSIANTAWVTNYVQSEFAGTGGLATQEWVLANTVNTFNGRYGVVSLNTADITNAGGAPINSPQFTGTPQAPTAPPGQASGQIATTLFVQQAIVQNTTGVVSFNTRTGAIVLEAADINGAGGALIASPAFTGTPTAPTAPVGTNDTQLATTAFVLQEVSAIGAGVLSFNGRSGVVTLTLGDIEGAGGAPLANPNFTGNPTAPTPTSPVAATTSVANTNWVVQYNALNTVASFNGRIGAVTLSAADVSGAGALVNPSPALTGTPTAPTQAPSDNSTAIATTAYVHAALTNFGGVLSFNTRTGAVTLALADITGAGGAPLASPIFTGTPAGPTAAPGTSTTQLATTAFVLAAIASSGVSSFNGRTGAVTLSLADITAAGGAPLANPALSGVPTAPTAPPGTNTTQLATTAFVTAAVGALGTGPFLPLLGGTLTGNLTMPGTATFNMTGTFIVSPSGMTYPGILSATTSSFNVAPPFVANNGISVPTGTLTTANSATIGGHGIYYQNYAPANAVALAWNIGGSNALTLYVDNTFVGSFNITASDQSLKENFAALSVDPLAVLDQIQLQQFDWKPTQWGQKPHASCGFTAQQIETLVPEAVIATPNQPMSVDTMPLLAYCIGAIQQLSARLGALEAKLA